MKHIIALVLAFLLAVSCSSQPIEGFGLCIISNDSSSNVNGDVPYPMHSVVKFPQAIYVADCMNRNGISLDSTVTVQKSLLMKDTWSPMLSSMGESRDYTIRELLRLSLVESDNNACDLLFNIFGMPERVDAYVKGLGFDGISISASERQMHEGAALSAGNCCTPLAMAGFLLWFNEHRDDNPYLQEVWAMMANCNTGKDRIPAAVPDGCTVIHKTGTGPSLEGKVPPMNDAGLVMFPDGKVMAVAIFMPAPDSPTQLAETVESRLAGLLAR